MSERMLPEHIDPFRYAEQGLGLSGVINTTDMHRLKAGISLHTDKIAVDLQFGVDEQGLTFLKGHLKTMLVLQCQRCMQPFNYEILSDFLLGIVKSLDEVNTLPEHYEPAVTKEGQLVLRELIEDELILNLPIIPRHEPDDCTVKVTQAEAGWEQGKAENPFRVLRSLKDKQK
jgi:uncharacterized protein